MTEETKERYEEDKPHYEVIRSIVKEELKMINTIMKWFITSILSVFAFMFLVQMNLTKEVQGKANAAEIKTEFEKADKMYLQKWDYYQIEQDEHRVMKEIIRNPAQVDYLIDIINNNIVEKLGYKYQSRGSEK